MINEEDNDQLSRVLANILCQAAEQGSIALGLTNAQTAEAFAMALVSYVAASAVRGKEAAAVRAMADIVGAYETKIACAAMMNNFETGSIN